MARRAVCFFRFVSSFRATPVSLPNDGKGKQKTSYAVVLNGVRILSTKSVRRRRKEIVRNGRYQYGLKALFRSAQIEIGGDKIRARHFYGFGDEENGGR
ncbi:hypothetical protein Trydic_g14113 [Trypoxylus dichotomus]